MDEQLLLILALAVAGPIIGSLIGVIRRPKDSFMYNMLAFAGGVMLAISFLQLIPESISLVENDLSQLENVKIISLLICALGIFLGAIIMFLLDKLIPHIHPELCTPEQGSKLKKTAFYLLLGIFMHNIPEGMAVALGEVSDNASVIIIGLAIAIHNIPEGICTSAPYYNVSKKRLKSFLISSLTAIPILIGFVIASILYNYISDTLIGLIAGLTAGFMIYIVGDGIIPTACSTTDHKPIFSLIIGIVFVILLGIIV
jgi:ZIP family zinc transporter